MPKARCIDTKPHLLREQAVALRVVLAGVVPALFGLIAGLSLGIGPAPYLALSILGIGGGFVAGMEHLGAREGALRGLIGGVLFGSSILLGAEFVSEGDHHVLPHPALLLPVITTIFGIVLGALGGRKRGRQEAPAEG